MKNRIREIRESKDLSLETVAKRANTSKDQISKLERGDRRLTTEWMDRIAAALHCEAADLLPKTKMNLSDSVVNNLFQAQPVAEYVHINVYDVLASAGAGFLLDDYTAIIDQLAFKLSWLKKRTSASIDQLAIIKVRGDSMYPTLNDDDDVLVDRTKIRIDGGGIFVIEEDGKISVKRLIMAKNKVRIISDNPIYPAYEATGISVVGRVIWRGQNL